MRAVTINKDELREVVQHNRDVVQRNEHEFTQHVQDDWGWKGRFRETSAMYLRDSS